MNSILITSLLSILFADPGNAAYEGECGLEDEASHCSGQADASWMTYADAILDEINADDHDADAGLSLVQSNAGMMRRKIALRSMVAANAMPPSGENPNGQFGEAPVNADPKVELVVLGNNTNVTMLSIDSTHSGASDQPKHDDIGNADEGPVSFFQVGILAEEAHGAKGKNGTAQKAMEDTEVKHAQQPSRQYHQPVHQENPMGRMRSKGRETNHSLYKVYHEPMKSAATPSAKDADGHRVLSNTSAGRHAHSGRFKAKSVHRQVSRKEEDVSLCSPLVVAIFVLLVALAVLSVIYARQLPRKAAHRSDTYESVAQLPLLSSVDVQAQLSKIGGYDCAVPRPWSSGAPVRLRARVEGPLKGGIPLQAPLTKRPCVLYSASVSQRTHDGMHPMSISFSSMSLSFVVRLVDKPSFLIEVNGGDVFLFDQQDGRCVKTQRFSKAPDHWQMFALRARTAPIDAPGGVGKPFLGNSAMGSTLVAEDPPLEFQECALMVGVYITLVGELHRRPDGALVLQPWHAEKEANNESWRTSWERSDLEFLDPYASLHLAQSKQQSLTTVPYSGKVLVSDNRSLFVHGIGEKKKDFDSLADFS